MVKGDFLPLHDEPNCHVIRLFGSQAFICKVVVAELFCGRVVEAVTSTTHRKWPDVLAFHVLWPAPSNPQWLSSLPSLVHKMPHEIWQHHVVVWKVTPRGDNSDQLQVQVASLK